MEENLTPKFTIKRIGGYLHKIVPLVDSTGKVVHHVITPLMIELRIRDIMQIIVGSAILAIPVGFTEETWNLGESLPLKNVVLLTVISILFLAAFVYFTFYRYHLKGHVFQYIQRTTAIYILSLFVVGILLTTIEKCPWGMDNVLALKRIIIVAFPASMSAAVSDSIK